MTWRERLLDPRPLDHLDLERASRWATCAVHEYHRLYPEVVVYVAPQPQPGEVGPADLTLRSLGSDFELAIARQDRAWATEVLDAIEARVAELKSPHPGATTTS